MTVKVIIYHKIKIPNSNYELSLLIFTRRTIIIILSIIFVFVFFLFYILLFYYQGDYVITTQIMICCTPGYSSARQSEHILYSDSTQSAKHSGQYVCWHLVMKTSSSSLCFTRHTGHTSFVYSLWSTPSQMVRHPGSSSS